MTNHQKLSYAVLAASVGLAIQGCTDGDGVNSENTPDPNPDYDGDCYLGEILVDGDCLACADIDDNAELGLLMSNEDHSECVGCWSVDPSTPIFNATSEFGCQACPEHSKIFMFGTANANRCVNATYAEVTDRLLETEVYSRKSKKAHQASFVHLDNRMDTETARLDNLYDWFIKFKLWVIEKIKWLKWYIDDEIRKVYEYVKDEIRKVYTYIDDTVIPQLEQYARDRANEAEANANKYTDEQIAFLVKRIEDLEALVDFKVDRRVVKCHNIKGETAIVPFDHGNGGFSKGICDTMRPGNPAVGRPPTPLPGTGTGSGLPLPEVPE